MFLGADVLSVDWASPVWRGQQFLGRPEAGWSFIWSVGQSELANISSVSLDKLLTHICLCYQPVLISCWPVEMHCFQLVSVSQSILYVNVPIFTE